MSETSPEYLAEVEQSFGKNLKMSLKKDFLDVDDERLMFGPTMNATTSSGLELVMHTICALADFKQHIYTNAGSVPHVLSYLVFALTADDARIAGYRSVQLGSTDYDMQAVSAITTAIRGAGVATKLDMAAMFLLRSKAAQMRMPIQWRVENGNLNMLIEKCKNGADPKVLSFYQDEQVRWNSLYGPDGKLGFNDAGVQTILPSRDYELYDPYKIDQMRLADFELQSGSRRLIIPWPLDVRRGDRWELHERMLADYRERIEPMIQRIIK